MTKKAICYMTVLALISTGLFLRPWERQEEYLGKETLTAPHTPSEEISRETFDSRSFLPLRHPESRFFQRIDRTDQSLSISLSSSNIKSTVADDPLAQKTLEATDEWILTIDHKKRRFHLLLETSGEKTLLSGIRVEREKLQTDSIWFDPKVPLLGEASVVGQPAHHTSVQAQAQMDLTMGPIHQSTTVTLTGEVQVLWEKCPPLTVDGAEKNHVISLHLSLTLMAEGTVAGFPFQRELDGNLIGILASGEGFLQINNDGDIYQLETIETGTLRHAEEFNP